MSLSGHPASLRVLQPCEAVHLALETHPLVERPFLILGMTHH